MFSPFEAIKATVIPPWVKPVAIAIIVAGLFGTGYFKGRWGAQAACQSDALRAQLTEMKRQAAAREAINARSEAMATAAAQKVIKLSQEADQYEQELAKRSPDARCMLNADDARRLQQLYPEQGGR